MRASEGFGSRRGVSARRRQEAELFYEALVGESVEGWREDGNPSPAAAPAAAPTIRLSAPEVMVCVGGINNTTIRATVTGGGTVRWRVSDPTRASITRTGTTATIRGRHPGVTTIEASVTSGGTTVTATARLLVVFIELELRATGTIVPSPENEDAATERAAAGGLDGLGPLPMGSGRGDFPAQTYTAPIHVVGRIFPAEAARRVSFRWQRLITRRSWRIQRNPAGTRWNVTFRSARGPLADDTGAAAFNDATPSTPGRRIYIYDNSALLLAGEPLAVGEFVHEKKDFIYRVSARINGVWTICSAIHVGQILTARRTATTGTVATDWAGVENSNAIRRLTNRIDVAEVRGIVGGTDPIDIAAGANP